MNPNAYIDADTIPYIIGFTTEDVVRSEIVADRIDTFIHENVFDPLTFDWEFNSGWVYHFFIGSQDKSNFRYSIYPEYKANRVQPKPRHFQYIREYLIENYNAIEVSGWEVDDEVAMRSQKDPTSIICSIDKDLDQLPGDHWNYSSRKMLRYYIDDDQAINWFYRQILIGDTTDNIKGVYGIGPKKAEKILAGLSEEQQYYEVCLQTYLDNGRKEEEMILNGQLLWLLRKPLAEGGLWQPPNERS